MTSLARTALWLAALVAMGVLLTLFAFRIAALWREADDDQARRPAGQIVETARGSVFVQMRGPESGPAVLLVPGTAAWGGFWRDVMEELGRSGYRAIAVDAPPFGFSEHRARADYARADQAERLRDVIRSLRLERPVVLGHSFGAGSVMELAARHGDILRGIVIVCGALDLPAGADAHPRPDAIIETLVHVQPLMRTATAALVTNPLTLQPLLRTMLHRKDAATDTQAGILLQPMARRGTTEAYAQWLPFLLLPDRGARTSTEAGVAGVTVPVALIWGELDTVTPLPQGRRLQGLLAGSSLDVIPDAGHIPHIEAPAAFMETLKGRLAELARRP